MKKGYKNYPHTPLKLWSCDQNQYKKIYKTQRSTTQSISETFKCRINITIINSQNHRNGKEIRRKTLFKGGKCKMQIWITKREEAKIISSCLLKYLCELQEKTQENKTYAPDEKLTRAAVACFSVIGRMKSITSANEKEEPKIQWRKKRRRSSK